MGRAPTPTARAQLYGVLRRESLSCCARVRDWSENARGEAISPRVGSRAAGGRHALSSTSARTRTRPHSNPRCATLAGAMAEAEAPPAKKRNRWDQDNGGANIAAAAAAAASKVAQSAKAAQAAAQAAEVTRQIQAAAALAATAATSNQLAPKPPTVTLDTQGRLVDERGKLIKTSQRSMASVKANQTARVNPLLKAMQEGPPPDATGNKYYDPRMSLPGQARDQRKKRALHFVSEGHFSKKGDDIRAKAAIEQMLSEARDAPKKKQGAPTSASLCTAQGTGDTAHRLSSGCGCHALWKVRL